MLRAVNITLIVFSLLLIAPINVHAAVVTVDTDGSVIWNVLPAHDDISSPPPESLEVTSLANSTKPSGKAEIALRNSSGKVELTVNDGKDTQSADVTGYASEIVEIEHREAPSKIAITVSGAGFILKEKNISAYTAFPITIDPEQKRISVETSSGEQYLSILPSMAVLNVVQSQVLDIIDGDYFVLADGEMGEVQYTIHGKKTLDILNIFEYEVPVTANVSALNGKVISVDQPAWLPFASFLFT